MAAVMRATPAQPDQLGFVVTQGGTYDWGREVGP